MNGLKKYWPLVAYLVLIFVCVKWVGEKRARYSARAEELTRIERVKSGLSTLFERRGDIEETNRGLARLTENCKQLFASNSGRSQVLAALSEMAGSSGARLRAIEPKGETATPYFRKWPLVITVSGTYADIVGYVSRIEQAQTVMCVDGIEIRGLGESRGQLTGAIYVTAYLGESAA